uniref:UspA domain-containing protein n=1 Tax=Percolomonas cosmopolitus TaxID=63605 RepID=A0A7S1KTX9_9EUKA|mmetsp:Transcript_9499/g.35235  ORF Transcript_9499/g.35235 Transcript_9499/m.35235 type:complete len:303 (+) Transcript_9499:491-1399(+)|eukprot:CAMPEP_0117450226 /NCGR_PEP_ID=MMETSP0759-20121206/8356_1 /TAXON_ID=63605 /ORGANISM="Percolomonas cosmopolitus, Strain WS" /LENGTH=302 /DNA_ID=CAMNT_0005242735 /DNA_START=465 /DNA_END=1373 /DNA_ORIENTATION=+
MPFPRILFPTDFSEAANEHLPYVQYILSHVKPDELCVLTVNRLSPSNTPVERKTEDQLDFDAQTLERMSDDFDSRKDEYLSKLQREDESKVEFKQRHGKFVEVVKSEANNYQLLIMGTHGRGFVQAKLLGSNCSKIVSAVNIRCPILVIPTHKISNLHIHKMVYATQLRNGKVDVQNLRKFLEFASYFHAKIVFVHVDKYYATNANESEKQGYLLQQRKQEMVEKLQEQIDPHCPEHIKHKYCVLFDKSVARSLTEYVREKDVDLLALIKVKRSFISKLFHSSLTKNMSLSSHIPLMIFNQT